MRTRAGIVALFVTTASSAAPPHVSDGMLVDQHGMTLYVFGGKGPPDAASCAGDCKRNFPPAVAVPGDTPTGSLTLVATPTGERQWAYKGQPLYHGLMDKKPGDHQADGLNGIWHPVRP